MSPETVNAIKDALAPIAAKIGQGAEYGWDVVVRQQYINGITSFVLAGFCLVGAILLGFIVKHAIGEVEKNRYSNWFIGIVVGSMGVVILTIASATNVVSGIQHLLNPAYYALDFFIHLGSAAK